MSFIKVKQNLFELFLLLKQTGRNNTTVKLNCKVMFYLTTQNCKSETINFYFEILTHTINCQRKSPIR